MADSGRAALDRFIENLLKSGLLAKVELDEVLNSLDRPDAPYGKTLTSLASLLIGRGLLTAWQVSKLREDKYKGFFLDDFVLLDVLEVLGDCQRYLARNTTNGRLVALKVFPPVSRLSRGSFKYEVEEI